jgi:hypothetical protein
MARRRRVRARHHANQRRLARAVVAADRDDLAGGDLEIDAVQRVHRAVALADAGAAAGKAARGALLEHLVHVARVDQHRVHPQIRPVTRLVLSAPS